MPAVNLKRPYRRYQWKVLPQGMKNSPTLCQRFVDQALILVRQKYPEAYIAHYTDDILIAHQTSSVNEEILSCMIGQLTKFGLVIAPEKIQKKKPLSYLGQLIHDDYIVSQKISIRTDRLRNLNDFQKLLGNINWIRPSLKITTGELSPLFQLLQGDTDPKSPRIMTQEAIKALALVEEKLNDARGKQISYDKEWD